MSVLWRVKNQNEKCHCILNRSLALNWISYIVSEANWAQSSETRIFSDQKYSGKFRDILWYKYQVCWLLKYLHQSEEKIIISRFDENIFGHWTSDINYQYDDHNEINLRKSLEIISFRNLWDKCIKLVLANNSSSSSLLVCLWWILANIR